MAKRNIIYLLLILFSFLGHSNAYAASPRSWPTPSAWGCDTPPTGIGASCDGAAHTNYRYVTNNGNDTNDGTTDTNAHAWLTIGHAVSTITSGQTICVQSGTYNEDLNITSSGTSTSWKILTMENGTNAVCATTNGASSPTVGGNCPKVLSIKLNASDWVINHMDVSNQEASNTPQGSVVRGIYDVNNNNVITNNYVHELCEEGIFILDGENCNLIDNNVVWHARMTGIWGRGTHYQISNNDVSDTIQFPTLYSSKYSACPLGRSGPDADTIRFAGHSNVIAGNNLHDIVGTGPNTYNACPHTDCFQTSAGGEDTYDILFDSNVCHWPAIYNVTQACNESGSGSTTGSLQNHYGNIDMNGTQTATTALTFQNNVFYNAYQGMDFLSSVVTDVNWWNNTTDSTTSRQLIWNGTPVVGTVVENNIFSGETDGNPFINIGTNITFATNVCDSSRSGSSCPVAIGTDGIIANISNSSSFTNYGTSPAFNDADYHVKNASSTIKNSGTTVPSNILDITGCYRPQNTTYSIGAYELTGGPQKNNTSQSMW